MDEILQKIGLTRGESEVYLTLLKVGNTTSGKLIKESKVSRSKVYEVLERLKQKGLATEMIKENIRHFEATTPSKILELIKKEKLDLQKKEKQAKEIIPKLNHLRKTYENPQEVKIYVGLEGVKSFYTELLNNIKTDYLAMTFADKAIDASLIRFFHNFHQKRAEKKIYARIISNKNDKKSINSMNFSDTKFYQFRTTSQILPTGIAIFNDTVATANWGKTPKIFSIICKENADSYRKFFNEVWKSSIP